MEFSYYVNDHLWQLSQLPIGVTNVMLMITFDKFLQIPTDSAKFYIIPYGIPFQLSNEFSCCHVNGYLWQFLQKSPESHKSHVNDYLWHLKKYLILYLKILTEYSFHNKVFSCHVNYYLW